MGTPRVLLFRLPTAAISCSSVKSTHSTVTCTRQSHVRSRSLKDGMKTIHEKALDAHTRFVYKSAHEFPRTATRPDLYTVYTVYVGRVCVSSGGRNVALQS